MNGTHRFESRATAEQKATIAERIRNGEASSTIAAEFGVGNDTVRKWAGIPKQKPGRPRLDPKGVPPPGEPAKYKAAPGRRPITEHTAGMLVAGIFTVLSILDYKGREVWLLTTVERDALSSPLADSMRSLPSPIADAVNTYSAPATFLSVLATVIAHKVNERAAAILAKQRAPIPRPASGFASAPTGFASAQPAGAPAPAAAPAAPRSAPFESAPPSSPASDPDLAAALAAAHGSLSGLDPSAEAEAIFS